MQRRSQIEVDLNQAHDIWLFKVEVNVCIRSLVRSTDRGIELNRPAEEHGAPVDMLRPYDFWTILATMEQDRQV